MVVMNPYFQHGDGIGNASEKYLYEDLIIEGLKIYAYPEGILYDNIPTKEVFEVLENHLKGNFKKYHQT